MAECARTWKCSLKSCTSGPITVNDRRHEIQADLPSSKPARDQFCISWSTKGDAVFHETCWINIVLKSARSRTNVKKTHGKSGETTRLLNMLQTEKTVIKEAAKTVETHDNEETFRSDGKRIADLIKKASHCVCFTGAGISTSAGIGDYRGKSGKWTEEDRKRKADGTWDESDDQPCASKKQKTGDDFDDSEEEESDGVAYEKLRPTYTHESLYKLMELGYLKYCISQNGDGLHGLSGISSNNISELHGNVFVEYCEKCDERYSRPFYVMDDDASAYYEEIEDYGKTDIKKPKHAKKCDLCGLSHRTGRKCVNGKCKGYLNDTIINFRDNLEEMVLDRAMSEADQCDLMLCLGTTLTVTPASELVERGKEPLRIVICNRQTTHMDQEAQKSSKNGKQYGARVFGDCDRLFKYIMSNILDKKALHNWEAHRGERMTKYNQQRS